MSVREYIGARYVPVFADPIQWDPTNVYEPLTVVTDQGASYVSRRYVPEGILLDNTEYWVLWADFNAQLQHYIDEVDAFDGRIDALEDALPIADYTSQATVSDAIDAVKDVLPFEDFSSASTVSDALDGLSTTITNQGIDIADIKKGILGNGKIVCIGDSIGQGWTSHGTVTPWPDIIGSIFGYAVGDIVNNSVGGRTFAGATETFTQAVLDTANTMTADEKAEVSLVIIAGGINDAIRNYTANDVANACASALANAFNSFPNAIVALFGPIMGNDGFCYKVRKIIGGLHIAATQIDSNSKLIWNLNAWQWLYDKPLYNGDKDTSYVASDHIHACGKGQKTIAHCMYNSIMGTSSENIPSQNIPVRTTASEKPGFTWVRNGAVVNWDVHANFASEAIANNNFIKFSDDADKRYAAYTGYYMQLWTGSSSSNVMNWNETQGYFVTQGAITGSAYGCGSYIIDHDIF